ncbi:unnamed protein product [Gongylonema pulchrum]|uniref:Gustatory receptor n=1 Tax=Gongylonema pulchrum TaxID=637853 RepID=A0A183E3B5_9BILA|nr:unnamed protein product [Gongylonema pulchrum]
MYSESQAKCLLCGIGSRDALWLRRPREQKTGAAYLLIFELYVTKMCNFSGALASIYLFHLGSRLHVIHERVLVQLAQFDVKLDDARKVRRFSFGLVIFVFVASAAISACSAAQNVVLEMPLPKSNLSVKENELRAKNSISVLSFRLSSSVYLEPLFDHKLIFIDIYVGTTPREAIHKISVFHERFQELHGAFGEVNRQYSYVHFYLYIVSVPLLCFILYVTLQERCDNSYGYPLIEYMIFAFWIIHLTLMILVFTKPAITLLEKSKELSAISAQIFTQLMFTSNDSALVVSFCHSQNYVQFFTINVRSESFAFSAGGFFSINKSIVLTVLQEFL